MGDAAALVYHDGWRVPEVRAGARIAERIEPTIVQAIGEAVQHERRKGIEQVIAALAAGSDLPDIGIVPGFDDLRDALIQRDKYALLYGPLPEFIEPLPEPLDAGDDDYCW